MHQRLTSRYLTHQNLHSLRTLSSTSTSTSSSRKLNLKKTLRKAIDNKPPNSQPFVTHRLRPGQPNPLTKIFKRKKIKSDPIYRPAWRLNSRANVISAEDFAARPRVTFEEQYDSLHDGMIVLSWLNESQRQDVYSMYLDMMVKQEKEFGVTSHEYVMRVIGEKFNISAARVAGIVQNCHDEEQMEKNDPEMIHHEAVEFVDAKIREHINNVYNAYGEVNPNEFIEDPIEVADIQNVSRDVTTVEDLYNIDELTQQAIMREKDEAQLEIDGHIYKEDVEDDQIESKVNKECLNLIEAQNEAFKQMNELWKRKNDQVENPLPKGGKIDVEEEDGNIVEKEAERRPRWKYVAQTINVRDKKKQQQNKGIQKRKKAKKEQKENTLVEQDGLLRVATMKEVSSIAWKDVRDETEFLFKGVKSAWLNRKNGERGGWGRVPEDVKAAAKNKLTELEKQEDNGNNDGDGDDVGTEDAPPVEDSTSDKK